MFKDAANDFQGWIKEPAFSKEQRDLLELDTDQHLIANTRTEKTGYRRVKGTADSGKSLALAAHAAVLVSTDKQILVCSFPRSC